MFEQIQAIVRNTFYESIRQPIMLVVLVVSTIMIVLSNPLSTFTMSNDQRMLVDVGMATVFFSGALLAAFIATNVLGQEIENRTALTVISKPVGRPLFVLGKYLGVAGALALGTLFLSLVFMLTELHTVIQTARDPLHLPVLTFGISAGLLGLIAAVWCNYFYDKVFASSVVCFTTPLLALAYLFSLMFASDFSPQPISTSFKGQIWLGLFSVQVAILVLTAIAITASTRLGQVMTLAVTIGVFFSGLLSDWFIGRRIANIEDNWLSRASGQGLTDSMEKTRQINMLGGEVQTITETIQVPQTGINLADMAAGSEVFLHGFFKFCYAIVPNFQLLWLSDAITQEHLIPSSYIFKSTMYGLIYIVLVLSAAIALFQRREVG
jgi:ABC-2 type transport system permease protein